MVLPEYLCKSFVVQLHFFLHITLSSFQNSSLESEEIMHILKPVEYNVSHYNI